MVRNPSRQRYATLALLVGGSFVGAAACGGINADDLFVDEGGSSGGAGGASTSSSSSASSSTSSSSSSTSSSTSSSSSSSSTGSSSSGSTDVCGDGVKAQSEACDGADLGAASCATYGYENPAGLACAADCTLDPSGCKPTCDGAMLEPTEVCDGNNLNGHTCLEFGYVNPSGLACTGCALDPAGCKATCGNATVEPGEQCDDGNTQNGDGCSSTCKKETNQGNTCGNAIAVNVALGSQTIDGATTGGGSHNGSGCTGSGGPDRVYKLTAASSGFLTVSLSRSGTSYDSVLYISQACQEGGTITTLLCADSYDVQNNTPLNGGEVVSLRVQQGATYFVFVDGYGGGGSGTFKMTIDLSTGTDCNDPVPIPLEPGAPMTLLGNNFFTTPTTSGTCGGGPGGQIVYRVTRPDSADISVATDPTYTTNFNSVLYARTTCGSQSSEIACSNQGGTAMESVNFAATADTPVFLYVDGSTSGGGSASGNYGLTVTP